MHKRPDLTRPLTSLEDRFGRSSGWIRSAVYLVFLCIVAYLDYADTRHLQFYIFYALFVLGVGWFDGAAAAVGAAFVASATTVASDSWSAGVLPPVELMNQAMRTILWLMLGLGAAHRRRRLTDLAEHQKILAGIYAKVSADLEAAQRVQEALLSQPLPEDERLTTILRRRAFQGLGGDYIEASLKDDLLRICIADVSGKGPSAALVTALLRGLLRDTNRSSSPAEIMCRLNARLKPILPDTMFVTCLFLQCDLRNGALVYANAGHDPGFIREASGSLRSLDNTGLPLGVVEHLEIDDEKDSLRPDDLLVLYTDGLTTVKFDENSRFGEDRLRSLIAMYAEPDVLAERLFEQVAPERQDDDVVILVAKISPCQTTA